MRAARPAPASPRRRPPAPRPPVLSGATLSLGARAEATSQWKKYSYMFVPVVVVFGVVTMGKHFMHGHHDHDEVPFPYMKKRDKAMPWALKGGSKCAAAPAPPPRQTTLPPPPPSLPRSRPNERTGRRPARASTRRPRARAPPSRRPPAPPSRCDLFDYDCAAKERAAKKALAEAEA